MKIVMDRQLAYACSLDEGNRNMRKNGRNKWNLEDRNIAASEFNRLWPPNNDLRYILESPRKEGKVINGTN